MFEAFPIYQVSVLTWLLRLPIEKPKVGVSNPLARDNDL